MMINKKYLLLLFILFGLSFNFFNFHLHHDHCHEEPTQCTLCYSIQSVAYTASACVLFIHFVYTRHQFSYTSLKPSYQKRYYKTRSPPIPSNVLVSLDYRYLDYKY